MQLLFSHESSSFQMFSSEAYGEKNLLFKDSTLELVPIATQNYETWLGREYLHAMRGLLCDPNRESCPCPCWLNLCCMKRGKILCEAPQGGTPTQAIWHVPVVPAGNLSLLLSGLQVWEGCTPTVVGPVEPSETLQGLGLRLLGPVSELLSPDNSYPTTPHACLFTFWAQELSLAQAMIAVASKWPPAFSPRPQISRV